MGSVDPIDDRTFSASFTALGVQKLRDRVNDKLKEFMGDYTDDALVEYVIVLLKNGRRRDEAKNELNVFLGDDSDSFVSWLWDHLATNISLYVQPEDEPPIKPKPSSTENLERNNSESDRGEPKRESKIRHNREWKGLIRDASDPPPLPSSEIENNHTHKRSRRRTRRSPSPRSVDKKRNRAEEQQESKRETTQGNAGATRRLLQFAVRDAVSLPRSSNTTTEPSLKRLRSVVSMPIDDDSERPRRIKSVARVPNAMATVIKAVAEAAEDSVRVKSSGSVFDRLGGGTSLSRPRASYEEGTIQDGDDEQLDRQKRSAYLQDDAEFASESEGYDDVKTSGGNKGENSMMVDKNAKRNVHQDQPPSASQKIVNISVNVNTWKPPREAVEVDASKSGIRITRDNTTNRVSVNGNKKAAADYQQDPQKNTLLPTTGSAGGRALEDVDSRTLFVSNVHFGATKDSLSRHFNKFGEVVKVVIVTDAATGQPIGSAYVEFTRKEAADNALSLDGTSFMSRLLKVVRRSGGQQETAAPSVVGMGMGWGRGGSPFARFPRRMFRGGRSRSFQWKRDGQPAVGESVTPRSLTYVRTEAAAATTATTTT